MTETALINGAHKSLWIKIIVNVGSILGVLLTVGGVAAFGAGKVNSLEAEQKTQAVINQRTDSRIEMVNREIEYQEQINKNRYGQILAAIQDLKETVEDIE